jgi:hypothetical protein
VTEIFVSYTSLDDWHQWRNHSSQVGGTTLTYSGFTEKFWGDQYIDGPMDLKFGDQSPRPHGGCAHDWHKIFQ